MKNTTTTGAVVAVTIAVLSAGCGGGGGSKRADRAAGAALVGTRVLAGSLVEARTGHQAIATDDGRSVLIVGGRTLSAPATDTAELWRAGRSVPLPASMIDARAGHGAVYLPTGEIWIVGGHDASGVALDTTELFDPLSQSFRPGPRLKAPRDEAAVSYTADGFVLAFGRGQPTIETWSSDLSRGKKLGVTERTREVHRITLEVTEKEAQVVEGRRGAQALVFEDGRVFVNGGTTDRGEAAFPLWIDPATGRGVRAQGHWHQTGEHHVLNGFAVGGTLDGARTDGLVIGGWFDEKPWLDVQRVRSGDEKLERAPGGLLSARERATVVALRRGVLVAGGLFHGGPRGQVEVITSTGTGIVPALQVARYDAAGTLLSDGTVLITGGIGADGLPVGVSELIVPAGSSAPSAEDLYAQARREKEEHDRLVAERDAAVAEVARLTAELSTTKAQLATAEARVRDLEARLARANGDLAAARADVAAARKDVEALRGAEASLKAQLASAQAKASAPTTLSPEQARHEFVKAVLASKAPLPSGAYGITSDEVARVEYELRYGTAPTFVPKPGK